MSVYVVDLAPYSSRGSIYVFERMTTGLYFGEIGYASSNGSSDVGYARVWNASSDAELAYQTFPVALGNQTFSIILDTNSPTDSWNFSVGDSTQFVYSMSTSIPTSQTFTGVEESGEKSFIFPNISFSNVILASDSSGVWVPSVDGYAVLSNYPGSNIAGVEGHAQDPLIPPDEVLIGGYLPDPAGNSNGLW